MKRLPKEYRSQADRIIRKFGGPGRLSRLLNTLNPERGLNRSTIYRWRYPRARGGTGGIIPISDLDLIKKAATLDGIILTEWDLYPGEIPKDRMDDILNSEGDPLGE